MQRRFGDDAALRTARTTVPSSRALHRIKI